MDSWTLMAITFCLLGSSAAGYIYGAETNSSRAKNLENKLDNILKDPSCYRHARDVYLSQ